MIPTRPHPKHKPIPLLYDELTENWRRVETYLVSLGIQQLIQWRFEDPQGIARNFLGIVKIHGAWRLCLKRYCDEDELESHDWKPITECSLREKVYSSSHIISLYKEIKRILDSFPSEVEEAIQYLTEALEETTP